MDNLEKKVLCLGVVLLGLFSFLFCGHGVVMLLIPGGVYEWIYWLSYSIFLVYVYKYFVDNRLTIIKCILFSILIIGIKFIIDIIMFRINKNLIDLLLSVFISQIEAFLFQLLLLITLFFVFGRRKFLNKFSFVKKPLFVLGGLILLYTTIALMFRLQDPIDITLNLGTNLSYQLVLKMRYVNFVFNLCVLPCLWIILRKITTEKNFIK